jgi:hypothetical protein
MSGLMPASQKYERNAQMYWSLRDRVRATQDIDRINSDYICILKARKLLLTSKTSVA